MSFSGYKEAIEEGDTVILYLSATSMHALRVARTIRNKHGETVDNIFQTTYGALKVPSLIGKGFGSKVELTRGWAYVLHPTPELWTLTLPHRTQINYSTDISMIVFQLEIGPGSCVIEAGTGSGSLTHALARSVAPTGKVRSFDFHEQRVAVAKEEFEAHGISGVVSVEQRDVCRDGFGPDLDDIADAVFLDLPHPWLVVPHVVKALKSKGGRFCSFSPCIEQVQRTCEALRSSGFVEVTTLECLQREILVCPRALPTISLDKNDTSGADRKHSFISTGYSQTMPGHTGYLSVATLPPVWARFAEDPLPDPEPTEEESAGPQ